MNVHTGDTYRVLEANAHRITKDTRDGDRDLGVALYLADVQDGKCWDCGRADVSEFLHFVGSSARAVNVDGTLYAPGAMGCRECNEVHQAVCKTLGTPGRLPVSYVLSGARALPVLAVLPTRAALVALAKPVQAARKSRIADALAAL